MPRSSTDDSDSESETETDITSEGDRGRRHGRYPMQHAHPGMGGMPMYPPMMHHHHHHHHHHMGHHMMYPMPQDALSPGPGGVSSSDATGETEMAARERARTLLLEFREAKTNLSNAEKALESSQAENERLNQVLYQQRMLFAKERSDFQLQKDQFERDKAALSDKVPDSAQSHIDEMANSVIEANRDKVVLGEELRALKERHDSLQREYQDLERLYLMQESEIQVLREALESEKEKAASSLEAVEQNYASRMKALEEGTARKADLDNSRVITDLMRDNEALKHQLGAAREDAAASAAEVKAITMSGLSQAVAGPPVTPTRGPRSPASFGGDPMNLELINRLSSEVGVLRQQLAAAHEAPIASQASQLNSTLERFQGIASDAQRENRALAEENQALRLEVQQAKLSSIEHTVAGSGDAAERSALLSEVRRLRSEINSQQQEPLRTALASTDKELIRKQLEDIKREVLQSKDASEGGGSEREQMTREISGLRKELTHAHSLQQAILSSASAHEGRDQGLALLLSELRTLRQENDDLRVQRTRDKEAQERDNAAILEEMRVLRKDLQAARSAGAQVSPAEAEALRRDAASLQAELDQARVDLAKAQEARRQLQSAAAAARLHRQADTNVLKEAERLRGQVADMEAKVAGAETSGTQAARQLQREEKRHVATRQRLESIAKEHDAVLSVLEKAKEEKSEMKAALRKTRKAADDAKSDSGVLSTENHALKQQVEYLKSKLRESEQLRAEAERQRDGLGVAVRQASDSNYIAAKKLEEQEEALSHERLQLHSAMRQQEAEFHRQREALEKELLQKDVSRQLEEREWQGSEQRGQGKYRDLERKVELLMNQHQSKHQSPPRHAVVGGMAPESPDAGFTDQTSLPVHSTSRPHESATVRHLAEQVSTKDRELEGLRSEMDELRRLVEAGMLSSPPSHGSRVGTGSVASFRPHPSTAATPSRQAGVSSHMSRAHTPLSGAKSDSIRKFHSQGTRSGPL